MLARANAADPQRLAWLGLLLACVIALTLAVGARVAGVAAVPSVLRTTAVALALFAICGYAPAKALVRGELCAHWTLFVLPLGAVISSLALACLGLLHVPLGASLAIVLGAGAVSSIATARRPHAAPDRDPASSRVVPIILPLLLAGLIGLVSLIPIFRSGFSTVPGQNGDAILVVGSAVLLQHAPPTADRPGLPINHIPLQWRSKYPIYYALAAVATLAGQDPIQAFAPVSGLVLAMTVLGLFLFARYTVRAPPWVALLGMFVVPLDRIVMYVTVHPYYNELWGQFTLPFMLVAGWGYLRAPGRRSAVLFALFAVLGLLAYPLMVPFPAFFLGAYAVVLRRRRRAAGEPTRWFSALEIPRPGARSWLWIPVVVVAVPVTLVLVRGFFEKVLSALAVTAPWKSLAGWSGTALPFLPWPHFVGMPGNGPLDVGGLLFVALLAGFALWELRSDIGSALSAMVLATVLIGVYFRLRTGGQLFFFKDLAFLGPYVLMLALVGLATLAASSVRLRARLGLAGLGLAIVVVPLSAAREIDQTYVQANPYVLELRGWDRALPPGTSVRIDVPPSGYQLWTTYMFDDHPVSALDPLAGFFPHPPTGRKADYVIADRTQARPTDAVGPPLFVNPQFELWRMNPGVPGPDVSSQRQLDIRKVTIGL